ncbi:MAG: heterodisulfide reductase-related iron-sulfur binding cluster [Rikenellaceae bacterium]
MTYYAHFIIPFTLGVIVLFSIVIYNYIKWLCQLPTEQKQLIYKGIFTKKSIDAIIEVISESLLHRRIFKTNPLLGYMHMSLAFGWFLLIAVGFIETTAYLGWNMVPPHVHVFFKYFSMGLDHSRAAVDFGFIMDLLLLFVLSGVALAWFKRLRSRSLGMRKTTKHTLGDKVALSALWFVFPLRLLAESTTSAICGNGSFLTGTLGDLLSKIASPECVFMLENISWWSYSTALGLFFVSMPLSRYMHIFTEIPLIFLRHYGLKSQEKVTSFDNFQLQACSRCGICIDPCQLNRDAHINNVQSVYFIRDRRYGNLKSEIVDNCLMCGRCSQACPVDVDVDTLRLNSRAELRDGSAEQRFNYLNGVDTSSGEGKVGYFAGCMTHLTPAILKAMTTIFDAAGEDIWWADRNGGVCCGRPLKLSGEIAAARKLMDFNCELFIKHGITTLVTSCPICYRVFNEEYNLDGIEVLHHSQYIERLINQGRLKFPKSEVKYTYHDPCELGRGSGIYDQPRNVVSAIGTIVELNESREKGLCCGSSLANLKISDQEQVMISDALATQISKTKAEAVVSACPLCKKSIARSSQIPVYDLAEVVAAALQN